MVHVPTGIPKPFNTVFLSSTLWFLVICVPAYAQSDRIFSIPLSDLQTWSDKAVVPLNVEITGHSRVHKIDADCEMHFGAKSASFAGDPSGLVLEPMNLCLEPFPGKSAHADKDWQEFGDSLEGARIRVEGVPRIWPEHLVGGGPSNPNHAVELHPLVKLQRGSRVFDFSGFIFAPDGFPGGVSEATAEKILTDTEVDVTENRGLVEINFQAGRIGNFTTLEVSLNSDSIEDVTGGHRAKGEVILGRDRRVSVRLLTVEGTDIDQAIAQFKHARRNRKTTFEALVLFSLDPQALSKAAQSSHGTQVPVADPLQLILYGQPDTKD
jgi:hypothetical protein